MHGFLVWPKQRSRLFSLLMVIVVTAVVLLPSHAVTVTAANNAASSDWPLFGRDYNATRFSPLTQISATTVHQLGEAWSFNLGRFQVLSESYPQVVGRIMYVTTATDEVIALDAVNGKMLWRYAPKVNFSLSTGVGGYGVSVNRGVAIMNGRAYVMTFDNQLQALTLDTGEKVWSTEVADPHLGYYQTMAPTAWNGMIFVGGSGAEDGVRGFVAAYDAATGKQVWRFWTVPAPGHAWVPAGRHGGGTVYMPPTIDTRTGILYAGTGKPSPVLLGSARPGPNPHTDSIIALNARTGTLIWAYQEIPHDVWAYDAASPVVIFDVLKGGKTIHAVGEAGKSGYYFILDAHTGQPLFPRLAFVKENHKPPTTKGVLECPGSVGGTPYSPVAYSPLTHAAYISGIDFCFIETVTPQKLAQGGQADVAGLRAPAKAKPTGTMSAVNVNTGTFLWHVIMPTPMIGGAVATGSNLIFTGDQNGLLYAFTAQTGKILWKANLGLAFGTAPIVYAVDGKEYVASVIGGSAVTGSNNLGPLGASVMVLTLGGKPITPVPPAGSHLKP